MSHIFLLLEVDEAAVIASSSKAVEDLFNFCRSQTEGLRSGIQSSPQVWHAAMNAGVLEDNELSPLQIHTEDDISADAKLPSACFSAKSSMEEFSLADQSPTYFEATGFPTLSPTRHLMTPILTETMVKAQDAAMLRRSYLSALCIEGSVLYTPDDPDGLTGVVLQSTMYGAVIWTGDAFGNDEYRFLGLHGAAESWRQVCVWDPDDWKVMRVRARCPRSVKQKYPRVSVDRLPPFSLELQPTPNSELVAFAAEHAFKHMTLPALHLLWDFLGLEGRKPPTVRPTVRGLVAHVLGVLDDDDFEELFKQRDNVEPAEFDSVVEDNAELLKEVLVEEEVEEVEAAVKAAKMRRVSGSRKREHAQVPPAVVDGASPSSGSGAPPLPPPLAPPPAPAARIVAPPDDPPPLAPAPAPAARIVAPPDDRHWTQEEATDMLPRAKGCSICPGNNRTWQVRYRNRILTPRSRTITYNSEGDDAIQCHRRALLECLEWAWAVHVEMGGSPCTEDLRRLTGADP